MKLGYFMNAGNLGLKKEMAQVLDETREIVLYLEESDWDVIWFPEHHFGHEGYEVIPNPLMVSSDIGARTSRIRIGQAANIITYWHPLRLAEDIALLDQLTKGRVEFGIGRGIYPREAMNLNPTADVRDSATNRALFEETYEILLKALSNKFFSHKGKFYEFPYPGLEWRHRLSPHTPEFMDMKTAQITGVAVIPEPYQKPHPPISQVIDTPPSIKWAASQKIQGLFWQPTVPELKNRFELYREERSKAEGRDMPLGEGLGVLRDVYVADSMEQAEREAGEAVLAYFHWTCHFRGLGNMLLPGESLPPGGKLDPSTPGGKLDALTYEWLHPRNLLFGTPDYVAERIEEMRQELNLQTLLVGTSFPGLQHDKIMRSLKLFNEEVLPRVRGAKVRAAAAQ
ncbi:MAG: LLM class flavin-dependent oxidoreductase [Gammaproteobacteria bacterium]|nr:LLM class flavin-dependent oxidoreductase [Gammaproteobacteria bacterium]